MRKIVNGLRVRKTLVVLSEVLQAAQVVVPAGPENTDHRPEMGYFKLPVRKKMLWGRCLDSLTTVAGFVRRIMGYHTIHFSPMLVADRYYKNAVLLCLARLFGKKVVVHWFGLTEQMEQQLKQSRIAAAVYNWSYAKADINIVIGRTCGMMPPVYGSNGSSSGSVPQLQAGTGKPFLALHFPIPESKLASSVTVIEAVGELAKSLPLRLYLSGSRTALYRAANYIEQNNLRHIYLVIADRSNRYEETPPEADIQVFLTQQPGKKAVIVLESLTYGFPLISLPSGGVPKWIAKEHNNLLSDGADRLDTIGYEMAATGAAYNPAAASGRPFRDHRVSNELMKILMQYRSELN